MALTKKTIFISFLFITFSYLAFAQGGNNGTKVSLFYEQVRNFRQGYNLQSGGLQTEFFLGDGGWCSLGYSMSFGTHTRNNFTFHMPLGIYLAQYPLQAVGTRSGDWWLWGTLLCLIIPESVNFHIKLSNEFYVSPYIAPAGIDFWRDASDFSVWEPTFAAGIRLNVIKDEKWSLSPFLGVKTHYSKMNWSEIQFGTMIGVGF